MTVAAGVVAVLVVGIGWGEVLSRLLFREAGYVGKLVAASPRLWASWRAAHRVHVEACAWRSKRLPEREYWRDPSPQFRPLAWSTSPSPLDPELARQIGAAIDRGIERVLFGGSGVPVGLHQVDVTLVDITEHVRTPRPLGAGLTSEAAIARALHRLNAPRVGRIVRGS